MKIDQRLIDFLTGPAENTEERLVGMVHLSIERMESWADHLTLAILALNELESQAESQDMANRVSVIKREMIQTVKNIDAIKKLMTTPADTGTIH